MAFRRLAGILFIILVSCAYLNTFYNAKTYFNGAEKEYLMHGLNPRAQKNYRKVIEKCSKVLDRYPKSKYVDDALYLMAVSYLRLGEKQKSRRKFEELFTFYPGSKLRKKAMLDYASLLISMAEYDSARTIIRKIESRKNKIRVRLILAQLAYKEENYEAVARMGRELLKKTTRNKNAKEILKLAVLSALKMDSLEIAARFLNRIRDFDITPDDRFKTTILYLDLLYKQNKPDTALSIISGLRYTPESNEERVLSLYRVNFLLLRGDTATAKKELEKMLRTRKSDSIRVISVYRLARIYEEKDNLKIADSLYKTIIYSSYKPVSKKAKERDVVLQRVISLKDSTGCLNLSRLSELYLFELQRVNKALTTYKKVFDICKGINKQRALYALLFIYKQRDDTLSIKKLIREYPCDSISSSLRRMIEKGLNVKVKCQSPDTLK